MIKLACVLFLVAVASASEEGNFVKIPSRADNNHNYIRCPITEDQKDWVKLDHETVTQSGKLWQVVEGTTTYPRTGPGKELITCIRVIDLLANGKGGYAEALDGGLDFNYVTIRYYSQKSHGYKFEVEIWGMIPKP